MRNYASGTTPNILIYIVVVATGAPATGLGGGTAYFVTPDGAAVAATNTLVEVSNTNAKGWYYVLVDALDVLAAGDWTLSYQTPTTAANVGKTEFTVDAPVKLSGVQTIPRLLIDARGNGTGGLTIIGDTGNSGMDIGPGGGNADGVVIYNSGTGKDVNLSGSQTIACLGFTSDGSITGTVTGSPADDGSAFDVTIGVDRPDDFFTEAFCQIALSGNNNASPQTRLITSHQRLDATTATLNFSGSTGDRDAAFLSIPATGDTVRITGRG